MEDGKLRRSYSYIFTSRGPFCPPRPFFHPRNVSMELKVEIKVGAEFQESSRWHGPRIKDHGAASRECRDSTADSSNKLDSVRYGRRDSLCGTGSISLAMKLHISAPCTRYHFRNTVSVSIALHVCKNLHGIKAWWHWSRS